MSYIFISYAHKDKNFTTNLIHQIKSAGFTSWIDSEEIRAGDNWRQEIDDAIEASFAVIVIMTKAAKKSEYVTYEWSYALGAKISVIPVLRKPLKIHPRLDSLQYIDFTDDIAPWHKLIGELKKKQAERSIRILSPLNASPHVRRAFIDLNSLDHKKRKSAVRAFENIGDDDSIGGLLEASVDANPGVRKAAAKSLIKLKDKDPSKSELILSRLVDRLKHSDPDVRRLAAWVLGALKDPSAIPNLLDATKDDAPIVRGHAAGALEAIGDDRAIPRLTEMLGDFKKYRSDEALYEIHVNDIASRAIQNIRSPDASEILEQWNAFLHEHQSKQNRQT